MNPSFIRSQEPSLSVIIPALNESQGICETLAKVHDYLAANFKQWEIIVVDDGSTDATPSLITSFAEQVSKTSQIHLLRNSKRMGKGAALKKGVLASRFESVLFTDADLSMPIEQVATMLPLLETVDIAIASKRCRDAVIDYPLLRKLSGAMGQALIRICAVSDISDTQGGFKLFSGRVARSLFAVQLIPGFGFDFEVLYLAKRYGFKVSEVPFVGTHRVGGTISIGSYLQTLTEVGALVRNRLRGRYPSAPPRSEVDE